jgi:hypothetical protein
MRAALARRRQLDLLAGQIAEEIRTSPKVFEASQKLTDKAMSLSAGTPSASET